MVSNIEGLIYKSNKSKLPFLEELAQVEDLMMIALPETHPTKDVSDLEIK